jgi:hypothetical protein
MSPKPFDLVPLVRFALLFNLIVGLILSAISSASLHNSWDWGWNDELKRTMDALVAFYAISLIYSAALIFVDHRRTGPKILPPQVSASKAVARAAGDGILGLSLLILHVLVSIHANDSGSVVLHMYSGIGALPAR